MRLEILSSKIFFCQQNWNWTNFFFVHKNLFNFSESIFTECDLCPNAFVTSSTLQYQMSIIIHMLCYVFNHYFAINEYIHQTCLITLHARSKVIFIIKGKLNSLVFTDRFFQIQFTFCCHKQFSRQPNMKNSYRMWKCATLNVPFHYSFYLSGLLGEQISYSWQ